jgi:hypothetical protein
VSLVTPRFADPADRGCYDREPSPHRLEDAQGEALPVGHQQADLSPGQELLDVCALPEEVYPAGDAERRRERLHVARERAVTDQI